MKNLMVLLLILIVSSSASAVSISLVDIAGGQPGSESNPLDPSGSVTIVILSDTPLLSLDAVITITGNGSITDAIKKSTAVEWGWMSEFTFDPIFTGDTKVEIGPGNFFGATEAYVVIHCDGQGDVVVSLAGNQLHGGTKLPGGADVPDSDFSASTVTIHQAIPEPMTIALLGLGGLFLRRRK